ncbi:membrane-associated progesterone receptor component 1-like isoform X2 [Rattus rattus]|uniref:membrane-associated progesterone receptor component 1-like isoform X2 n=1 Tax=Rattus rattus TaxID=10117 RepID=UPI0013F37032|nr:membrane-associated progesterone receptor component 1-like isoform X2 [Rattus rattus]
MAAEDVVATGADPSELEGGGLLQEIFKSPLNLLLLGLCIFLLYKIVRWDQPGASGDDDNDYEPPPLPRLKPRDFTPAELRRYDGVQAPRILMAINRKVFDVTKGRKFYGPVKYHHVGKLLKEGEEPTVYSDDEEPKDETARKND